jgi:TolB-like protein
VGVDDDGSVPPDFLASGRLASAMRALGADLIGTSIGIYHITALLGVGGMGEVYRARDTKLGREVAIKILPGLFISDPDRLTRFEREARVLASLNHPHIGAIYGLEEADGVRALVLELVEGETLADRIARGPIPLADTLTIARQIAEALGAAHEKGIVHRDLKPANIKITPDGIVKVLDFGLAKATAGDGATRDLTQAPTETVGGTREGAVLGTAAYMSPEQARGKPVDKRTDIWAFGCVMYEMLTGRIAFAGETVSDTIVAILEREPDFAALPSTTPPAITRLLQRCLEKDARQRVRDIGDIATDLETPRGQMGGPGPRRTLWLSVGAAWAAGIVLLVAGTAGAIWTRTHPAPDEIRSIAILPLRALAPTPEGNHIGLGIADSIITKLGGTGALTVRPTSAIHRYAREAGDSLEAARQLRVDAVLEGSWRRDGNRLRVSAHMLRTRDGVTLWADTLDMHWSDIFTLEDQLSQQIIQRLRLALDPAGRARLAKRHTSNPEAYEYYTKAVYLFDDRSPGNVLKGIDLLERAIAADPLYAAAHAQLAYNYAQRSIQIEGTADWIDDAKREVERAAALDAELATVHVVRAFVVWSEFEGWRVEEAIRELKRAQELDPAIGHTELAELYLHIGLEERADREHELAIRHNPTSDSAKNSTIYEYYLSNRPDEGFAAERRLGREPEIRYFVEKRLVRELEPLVTASLAKAPAASFPRSYRGLLLSLKNRHDEAMAAVPGIIEVARHNRSYHHLTYNIARIYAAAGRPEPALKWLRATAENGFPQYPLFRRDAYLNPIRNNPAFVAWLAEVRSRWETYRRNYG